MSVTVEFIGDGSTRVTDINSNVLTLYRYQVAVLSDATWAGFSAQQQANFQVLLSPSQFDAAGLAAMVSGRAYAFTYILGGS